MRWLFFFFCLISVQLQANTSAIVDRTKIKIGQSVQLKISSDNAAGQVPNLSNIKRVFRVVGSSKISRPYLSNGKRKQKTLWFYILQPKRSGHLSIPSISINGEKTKKISIQVLALKKQNSSIKQKAKKKVISHDIIVKATINKNKLYPNEMLVYTLSVNFPDNSNSDFKVKEPFIGGAIILPLSEPSFKKIKVRSKARTIRSQSFAIFTEQVAYYQIEPASVSFNSSANQSAKTITLKANNLHFEVIQKANQTSLGYWLPTEQLNISQVWDIKQTNKKGISSTDNIYLGDTIQRTITLKSYGLNADILPLISTLTHENINIKLQDVNTKNTFEDGKLVAIRTEEVAMTFNKVGTIGIEPIDIHWWNTKFNQARVATLAAKRFNIIAAPQQATDTKQQLVSQPQQASSDAPNLNADTASNTLPIVSNINDSEANSSSAKLFSAKQLNWLIAILFTLLVATTVGWLLSSRKAKF